MPPEQAVSAALSLLFARERGQGAGDEQVPSRRQHGLRRASAPVGAIGVGLMAKMLAGLEATGGKFGLQVMCIGHGMSAATIIERL